MHRCARKANKGLTDFRAGDRIGSGQGRKGSDITSLGQRIKHFRESLGISQGRLSSLVGIPRPAISQIELGHRKISADELIRLSDAFRVSLDALVDPRNEPKVILEKGKAMEPSRPEVRISVPQRKLAKFREALIYILSRVGAKPNVGETVIYKLLYFIDFDYYEKYEEQLIGARYQRNKHGPTPMEFKKIVDRMIELGEVEKVRSSYFRYPQTKYLARRKADLSDFTANEKSTIDDVLDRLSDMNATEIAEYSHHDVPWLTTEPEGIIRYESVFYRTTPYSVRAYSGDV